MSGQGIGSTERKQKFPRHRSVALRRARSSTDVWQIQRFVLYYIFPRIQSIWLHLTIDVPQSKNGQTAGTMARVTITVFCNLLCVEIGNAVAVILHTYTHSLRLWCGVIAFQDVSVRGLDASAFKTTCLTMNSVSTSIALIYQYRQYHAFTSDGASHSFQTHPSTAFSCMLLRLILPL